MKLLVTGGRFYNNKDFVFQQLDIIKARHPITLVVNGGNPGRMVCQKNPVTKEIRTFRTFGADKLSTMWAKANNIETKIYKAEWEKYGKKSAGPIRNQQMIDEESPEIAAVFKGGFGTDDMVTRIRFHKKSSVYGGGCFLYIYDLRRIDSTFYPYDGFEGLSFRS